MSCPEMLATTQEEVGLLTFEYVSGDTGPARCRITNVRIGDSTSYPSWWNPDKKALRRHLARKDAPIFKFTISERRRPDKISCIGPIEFTQCMYKTAAYFMCEGVYLGEIEEGLVPGPKFVTGVCLDKIFDLVFSAGTSLLAKAAPDEVPRLKQQLAKDFGIEEGQTEKYVAFASPKLSRAGFEAVQSIFVSVTGREVDLSSSPFGELDEVDIAAAAETLQQAEDPTVRSFGDFLTSLAGARIDAAANYSANDVWVNVAASLARKLPTLESGPNADAAG